MQATPKAGAVTDLEILNFALGMEHLVNAFYNESEEFDLGTTETGASINQLFALMHLHTAAHVGTLIEDIDSRGGTPVPMLKYSFPVESAEDFYAIAQDVSSLLVHTYYGGMHLIQESRVLVGASQFAAVAAKSHAIICALAGASPLAPMVPYLSMGELQTLADIYISSQEI